jgi:hypothetical protein
MEGKRGASVGLATELDRRMRISKGMQEERQWSGGVVRVLWRR